jgi:hypothetical protein
MKIGKSSNYQLAAILTYAAFPEQGTKFTEVELMTRAVNNNFFSDVEFFQAPASNQFFMEPNNWWNNKYSNNNNKLTNDIFQDVYYQGSVLMRQTEKDKWAYLLDRTPLRVYRRYSSFKDLVFKTGSSTLKLNKYNRIKFAQLAFLKRYTISMMVRTNKSTKNTELVIYTQD